MSVKSTARRHYENIVDRAATQAIALRTPPEGWLRTARKALGMSGAQLARRMAVGRARIAQAESAETSGGVTLKSMQAMAEAMGCRFVYAIVPPKKIEDLIFARAREKAKTAVTAANTHMALEDQVPSKRQLAEEVTRLTRDIVHEMPADLWNDP
jgi:predicted DNA-binding mobile mystery protein A